MGDLRLDRVDYADRYSVALPAPMSAPQFCARVLESAPPWLDRLLSARDLVAGRLGFHTQERNYGVPVELTPGAKFGPLLVRSVDDDRVVCGDADRHVAFRASFEVADGRGIFTTEVATLDTVGRAYFAAVKPFHRMLIPRLVGGAFGVKAVSEQIS